MFVDSLSSFSSASEDENDIEIIHLADFVGATTGIVSPPPAAVRPFQSSNSKNTKKPVSEKSVNSCTFTGDDPKEIAESADSGSHLNNKISANKTLNKNTKRVLTSKTQIPLYYIIPLYILFYLIAKPFVGPFTDLYARSFLGGPTLMSVQSVTLTAFSSTSWRSREITVQGTVNLEFQSILNSENIFYDSIEVLVSSNGTDLSYEILNPFVQPPSSKSEVNVTFSSTIDASEIEEIIAPDDIVSLNLTVFTSVTEQKNARWNEKLFRRCRDIRVQFFQGSDVARMVNQNPVLCKFESDYWLPEIPDSKFREAVNKIRGIVEILFPSS